MGNAQSVEGRRTRPQGPSAGHPHQHPRNRTMKTPNFLPLAAETKQLTSLPKQQ